MKIVYQGLEKEHGKHARTLADLDEDLLALDLSHRHDIRSFSGKLTCRPIES
jgi:hypothetical protein